MERLIIFGRLANFFSSRKNETYYKIDYLDAQTGEAHTEFLNSNDYFKIEAKGLVPGEVCTAKFELNSYNRGVMVDVLTD